MSDRLKLQQKYSTIIIENQYFGTVNWYKMLFHGIDVEIEQYEPYPKTSFRNRCVIAGSNGLISLSVPLEKGRSQKAIFKDVRISNQMAWQEQHWRSIVSCYGKSPFFEFYRDGMEALFKKRFVFLIDLDLEILAWVKKQLKFSKPTKLTESYRAQYENNTLDWRDQVKPSQFRQVKHPLIYQQVFEDRIGFQPNLSVIDLLCCTGPAAKSLLENNILTI